jgi:hypothetical protein
MFLTRVDAYPDSPPEVTCTFFVPAFITTDGWREVLAKEAFSLILSLEE